VFYIPPEPALSATGKGQRTPPHLHMRTPGWHKPNHTRAPHTPVNHHLSPPPSNANSGGPTEPKDDEPRLGYYIQTTHTHTHVPYFICLGESSHHISTPSYTQSFLIYTLYSMMMRSQHPLLTLLFVFRSQHCKPDDGLRVGRNMLFH